MKIFTTLLAAGAITAAAGSAQAVPISYDATSFSNNGHSLWLQGAHDAFGLNQHFDFAPDAGIFDTDQKTWGTLTGDVLNRDGTNGFAVAFNYNDDDLDLRTGYKNGGGGAGNADNFFLNLVGGTLTGFGGILDGVILSVTRKPANGTLATQVGTGANDKNGNFGMSNWFMVACEQGCDTSAFGNRTQGDINVNLAATNRAPVPPVPLPAAGWLLIAGLGGLAAMKRRKDV